jgi:hypothetical protein
MATGTADPDFMDTPSHLVLDLDPDQDPGIKLHVNSQ